jgi:hypothetical protein
VLTPEQDAVIYAAIHADPVLDGFAKAGNDSEVAARLNSQTVTVYRRISTGQVRLWSAVRGLRQKLQDLALNGTNGKQSMALVFCDAMQSGDSHFELLPEVFAMVDRMVADGVFTADDRADLMARAAEQIGLAQSLVGQAVTIDDIGRILAVDRPGGKIPKEVSGGTA